RADVDWQETGKGAGVSADRTYMHLSGCTITGNVMEEAVVGNGELLGGGFYLYNSPLLLEHCVVDSNVCNNGSAIYADGGSPTTDPRPLDISHSRFSANSGKAAEHVIRSNARDRLQLIDVELSGNLHNSLIALADTNRIIGCLFAENRGQVYFSNDGTNENLIMNTTFTRSSPTLPALRVVNTNLTMINCTMVDDSLTGPGARELSLDNSVVQMKNTILAETFFHGSSAFGQTGGAVISLGGNVCVDGSLAAYLNQPTDANNTQPGMGTFADHGGYSRTWSLLPSSTCIDRGGPDTLTMDQRGFLRDADSDAGAFEFGAADPTIAIVSISPDQVVCEGGSLELSVTANSGVSLDHQWYLNGVAIPGATSATYSTAAVQADSGAYTCSVWNALDSTVVGPVMVQVEVCAGLNVHASDGLRIHPNPTDDASGLFIEFPAKAGVQQVTVLDAQGRLIKQLVVTGAERVHVPLYGSAPGAYTLHVRFHDGVLHRRFIVR
ncbi:MAG: T9SS type A sorting domain-containing protein, partial [Flavobacteriales bacterium]|nr:T9SS type A sorting domain-containing protein [Flavobacteriales bacterium]